jgi:hypothetical protein
MIGLAGSLCLIGLAGEGRDALVLKGDDPFAIAIDAGLGQELDFAVIPDKKDILQLALLADAAYESLVLV